MTYWLWNLAFVNIDDDRDSQCGVLTDPNAEASASWCAKLWWTQWIKLGLSHNSQTR